MKKIILGDLHFGVKQNSVTWLNSQLDFFYKQFIPYVINIGDTVEIIQLGDVFDSRSTISTLVATKVVELFKVLCNDIPNVSRVIIIGGNHDYYSPTSDSVDSLSLLLKKTGASIYTKEMHRVGRDLYIPWYEWIEKQNEIQSMINEGLVDNIYTHTDIVNEYVGLRGDFNLWSGHVHTPDMKEKRYNTGATYSLTFTDCNSERGFYVVDNDTDNIEFIPNTISISFWRLFNEDIFDKEFIDKIKPNDYIELYINQYNLIQDKYSKQIDWFLKNFKNCWNIPQASQNDLTCDEENAFKGYDMEDICKELIPEELVGKFEQVLESITKSKE